MRFRLALPQAALALIIHLALTGLTAPAAVALAQEKKVNPKPAPASAWLPNIPKNWGNSTPITANMLEGKAAFVWFFEETCPICAKKWPELFELSEKYQDAPIVFIAVNSGSTRNQLDKYIRKHKITWPVLFDAHRNSESLARVKRIDLENIYQLRMITPTGQTVRASVDDLEGAIKKQLETAKWNIDPKRIAPEHDYAWRMLEFKQYSTAAPTITRDLRSRDAALRRSAKVMSDWVGDEIDRRLDDVHQLKKDKAFYDAYVKLNNILTKFQGFEFPARASQAMNELKRHPAVQDEIKAGELLADAHSYLPNRVGRALRILHNLVKRYPKSKAAATAREEIKALEKRP